VSMAFVISAAFSVASVATTAGRGLHGDAAALQRALM
jgi:hypothetical protein